MGDMSDQSQDIVQLTRVPTEVEAELIVNLLQEHEIEARAVGGFTSTFRAQAPGDVQVFVRDIDLEQAREILREHENFS
jgi:nitrogen regulatory protein PII-like uncharacterized protein